MRPLLQYVQLCWRCGSEALSLTLLMPLYIDIDTEVEANAHTKHAFVMKKNVSDAWVPAIRENERKRAISADIISDLEGRELSTNDYELLLELDHAEKYPLQDYLLSILAGKKVEAEDAKAFGDASGQCILCSQTLRMLAALRVLPCDVS